MKYASKDDYVKLYPGDHIPDRELDAEIEAAQRDIDSLTFGRIRRRGFSALSDFQREIVAEAVCRHAKFLFDFGEALSTPITSYGIDGISVQWDTSKLISYGGITTTARVHGLLSQSGLNYRGTER